MRKILIGLGAAAVLLAGAAFVGVQWLVEREIAAAFAALRPALGAAAYGRPQFNPWTRTVRINDVALEGGPQGMPPMKIGEIALTFDLARLLRNWAQLGGGSRQPTPDEIAALFSALEAFEMDDVLVADRRPGRTAAMHLVLMRGAWKRPAGPIPTWAHYAVRGEISITDDFGEVFAALRDAGRNSVVFGFDMTSTWSEQTRTFALGPATFEMEGLFSVALTLSIDKVSPDLMTNDPAKTLAAAAALEIGPMGLAFHDSGGLDVALAQAAKIQGVDPAAARRISVEQINRNLRAMPRQSPELRRLADALASFISGSGGTLKIHLTPRGHVNIMQTVELMKLDPIAALSQFDVEAAVVGR
jgi:hypothetical protein